MSYENLDQMTQYAIETLLSDDAGTPALVRDMVRKWPDADILELVFALTGAANTIEGFFNRASPSHQLAQHGYKLAALVAADTYAMKTIGGFGHTTQDLMQYWLRHDPYFLNL